MSETNGVIGQASQRELLTDKLDRPMDKPDLDVFRTHLAGSCAEDTLLARDMVRAWRAGRAQAERRERAVLRAILGPDLPLVKEPGFLIKGPV